MSKPISPDDRLRELLQIELPGTAAVDETAVHPRDAELLNGLRIASPCDASWEQMEGDDLVRFCRHCQLNVYNLSGMSRREAAAFLREAEGRLCVRFYRRADGTLLTDNCPVGWRAARRRLLEGIGSAAGALGLAWLIIAPAYGPSTMGRRVTSLSILKQLGIAFEMYVQDYDDRLPPMTNPAAVKKALFPYVKSEAVFVHPTTREPYQPNPALSHRKRGSIEQPDKVVAFYEAHPSTDGTRRVLFADGHVEHVSEAVWPQVQRASKIP
jgi:prepilin-type processing-associated H-X9-DG protein